MKVVFGILVAGLAYLSLPLIGWAILFIFIL